MSEFEKVELQFDASDPCCVSLSILDDHLSKPILQDYGCTWPPIQNRRESVEGFTPRVEAFLASLRVMAVEFFSYHPAVKWVREQDTPVTFDYSTEPVTCIYKRSEQLKDSPCLGQMALKMAITRVKLTMRFEDVDAANRLAQLVQSNGLTYSQTSRDHTFSGMWTKLRAYKVNLGVMQTEHEFGVYRHNTQAQRFCVMFHSYNLEYADRTILDLSSRIRQSDYAELIKKLGNGQTASRILAFLSREPLGDWFLRHHETMVIRPYSRDHKSDVLTGLDFVISNREDAQLFVLSFSDQEVAQAA